MSNQVKLLVKYSEENNLKTAWTSDLGEGR